MIKKHTLDYADIVVAICPYCNTTITSDNLTNKDDLRRLYRYKCSGCGKSSSYESLDFIEIHASRIIFDNTGAVLNNNNKMEDTR